ncbi:MAG TPA: holo-ACP synthase [Actinomycetota bacterium]|nr:holo-ACP synthase [Actinomycetota bacterium]
MTIGVDVVDVARFRALLNRSPRVTQRFFTDEERAHCGAAADAAVRFAGTFAAKEAVMKALGLTPAPAWARRIRIVRAATGRPSAAVDGFAPVAVSISHDGPVAVAIALAPPDAPTGAPPGTPVVTDR